jgi:predicted nuclease of predicted toxin-antitoxin system
LILRFAADENFDGRIVRGVLRVLPDLDLVRVQDTPLAESDDHDVLEWAVKERRVVLTHDVSTMTAAAWARVRAGLPMSGVIEVGRRP